MERMFSIYVVVGNDYEEVFNIKVIPSMTKRIINGKERHDFMIRFINYKKHTIYFIQADSNIWWKPKKIVEKFKDSYGVGIGWLFVQVGYLIFY